MSLDRAGGLPAPSASPEPGQLRVAEVGCYTFFASGHAAGTDLYWSATKPAGFADRTLTVAALIRLIFRLRRGHYDLLVIHPPLHAPWRLRSIVYTVAGWRTKAARGLFATLAMRVVHRLHRTPTCVVDFNDTFGVERHNLTYLDAAQVYFKRELPVDCWQVLYKTAHGSLPGARFRSQEKQKGRIRRLQPLSLGHPWLPAARPAVAKETDIFFAGSVRANSLVRSRGLIELSSLAEEGFRVDVASERLPEDEYLDRMARAWLVWSPSGLGWDCYRHYEAGRVGSVALINLPTVLRHAPLIDGLHCFYYPPEPGGLAAIARKALKDKELLLRMALAAAAHVETHHTVRARAEHVAVVVNGRDLDGRPVSSPPAGEP